MAKLRWLVGTWHGETRNGGQFYETWVVAKDGSMHGSGFRVLKGDTVFGEGLRIEKRDRDLYYVAAVNENAAPAEFKMTAQRSFKTIFENPEHDFPQRITYQRRKDGSLYVTAELLDGGRKLEFFMKRVKVQRRPGKPPVSGAQRPPNTQESDTTRQEKP